LHVNDVTGKGIKECNGRKSSSELTRDKSMSTREREENTYSG
jgi:hypothetical protein